MKIKPNLKYLLLSIVILILALSLLGCSDNSDTVTDSDTSQITDSDYQSTDTDTDTDDEQGYFVATVSENEYVTYSFYTDGKELSENLNGIYYSADSPGGKPRNDGTGKIYLYVKPITTYTVLKVVVEGEYESVESLGRDLYCIHGVKSDLKVSANTRTMIATQKEYFQKHGYGITDDGTMVVTWEENPQEQLRYVEITYDSGSGSRTEYVDAELGKAELFKMQENKEYTVSLRAIGMNRIGKTVEVKCCYMNEPKSVSFPRVEITTQNFVWPDCDFVSSPEDCWGAGITNAFYEQCVMTIFNENNEIIYTSSNKTTENEDYLGAKMKIRGNTSARYASNGRYPYKIKLDQKADLLKSLIVRPDDSNRYADKDWLLLNYGNYDYRACGEAIGDAVGTEWTPEYCYVSLYINGEYRGLYVLSEAIEEGSGTDEDKYRVNVDTDGYVFECDAYWWNEDLSLATPLTENTPMHFTFKYPDPDEMTKDSYQYKYLKDYLTRFEEALMKEDDSYLEYIDLDSFVKWLLVSDYLCIEDGGGCNLFLYKKDSTDSSKIHMGPNWDFDSYMGNIYGLSTIRLTWDTAPFYYQYLIEKDSFQKRYCELFAQTYNKLNEYVENEFAKIDIENHYELIKFDNKRFGSSLKTLTSRKNTFLDWLDDHVEWMKTQFLIEENNSN